MNFASPTVNTVGGPMGLSFSYNSQQSPTQLLGLTGAYYDALNVGQSTTTNFTFAGRSPVLVRTDTLMRFDWKAESAGPAVPTDYFLAKWSGYLRVPVNASYTFGVVRDDGIKVTVDGSTVVNAWSTGSAPLAWGSAKSLTTSAVPVTIEYYDSTGNAGFELWVKWPGQAPLLVPADWFQYHSASAPERLDGLDSDRRRGGRLHLRDRDRIRCHFDGLERFCAHVYEGVQRAAIRPCWASMGSFRWTVRAEWYSRPMMALSLPSTLKARWPALHL